MKEKNNKSYIPGLRGEPTIYCGGCKRSLGIPKEGYKIGTKIECPKSSRYNYHVARIINNKPAEFWVTLENSIVKYELSYSPYRLLARLSEKIANSPKKKEKLNRLKNILNWLKLLTRAKGYISLYGISFLLILFFHLDL